METVFTFHMCSHVGESSASLLTAALTDQPEMMSVSGSHFPPRDLLCPKQYLPWQQSSRPNECDVENRIHLHRSWFLSVFYISTEVKHVQTFAYHCVLKRPKELLTLGRPEARDTAAVTQMFAHVLLCSLPAKWNTHNHLQVFCLGCSAALSVRWDVL